MAGGSDGGRGVGVGEERVAAGERDLEDGDAGTYVAEMYEGSGDEEEEVYSEDALEVKAYSDDDTQQVRCVYCYMKERERYFGKSWPMVSGTPTISSKLESILTASAYGAVRIWRAR